MFVKFLGNGINEKDSNYAPALAEAVLWSVKKIYQDMLGEYYLFAGPGLGFKKAPQILRLYLFTLNKNTRINIPHLKYY